LQRTGSLPGSNGGLTLFAIASIHQDDDGLKAFFDKREIIAKLFALLACDRVSFS